MVYCFVMERRKRPHISTRLNKKHMFIGERERQVQGLLSTPLCAMPNIRHLGPERCICQQLFTTVTEANCISAQSLSKTLVACEMQPRAFRKWVCVIEFSQNYSMHEATLKSVSINMTSSQGPRGNIAAKICN